MKKYLVLLVIPLLLTGCSAEVRLAEIAANYDSGYSQGYIDGQREIKQTSRIIYVDRLVMPPNVYATAEELEIVFSAIEHGIYAHQYYADHPEDQNKFTGNTTFSEEWVYYYEVIEELIVRAYGRPE